MAVVLGKGHEAPTVSCPTLPVTPMSARVISNNHWLSPHPDWHTVARHRYANRLGQGTPSLLSTVSRQMCG